jgi:hypothetical protein
MLKNILLGLSVLSNVATLAGLWIAYISAPATVQSRVGYVVLVSGAVCSIVLYLCLAWFVLRPRSSAYPPKITVLATSLSYSDVKPSLGFPLKMHVEMRNDHSRCINVRLSEYVSGFATVKNLPLDVLQIKYSGTWLPEKKTEERVAVLPRQQFRAWLGFDESKFTKEQLEQHRGKIGTLILGVNGKTVNIPL